MEFPSAVSCSGFTSITETGFLRQLLLSSPGELHVVFSNKLVGLIPVKPPIPRTGVGEEETGRERFHIGSGVFASTCWCQNEAMSGSSQ